LGRKNVPSPFCGMLAIYKPRGMISKDVSRYLEKKLGRLKMGHVGTLDPMAEGVLPLLFGKATRLQDYLLGMTKEYEFDVEFGRHTDTNDDDGQTLESIDPGIIERMAVELAASELTGERVQIPPIYSAVKYRGKPLYEYARSGKTTEVPLHDLERRVVIYSLKVVNLEGKIATFKARVSKGTYIRVLALEIAEKLGTIGVVTRLFRSESAGVLAKDAFTLDQVADKIGVFGNLVAPIESITIDMPKMHIKSTTHIDSLFHGKTLELDIEAFNKSIHLQNNLGKSESVFKVATELLLLDQFGKALGLGVARIKGSNQVVVDLKRGLV